MPFLYVVLLVRVINSYSLLSPIPCLARTKKMSLTLLSTSPLGALLWILLTNLAYLLPAIVAWELELYSNVVAKIAVSIVSSLHHVCYDVGLCDARLALALSHLDMMLAYYNIALDTMFMVNFDLVRHKYVIEDSDPSIERVVTRTALIRHTYADIALVVFEVLLFFCVTYFENTLTSALILMVYLVAVVIISFVLYWRIKRETFWQRFNVPLLIMVAIVAILGVSIFAFEVTIGRPFHGLWHLCGAATSLLILLASSNHLRKSRRAIFSRLFAFCK